MEEDDATLPYPSSNNSLADGDSVQDNYTVEVEMKLEENNGSQACNVFYFLEM